VPIHPLPQFEADLADHLKDEADRLAYEKLNAPKTIVVRFGTMKMVGEFPWNSNEKPGCGSKIVVRTHRGTEIGEMLTSTCPNSGCSKSVSRKEMLDYIENSGGRQYPFSTEGKALRIATREDMDHQAQIEQSRHGLRTMAKAHTEALGLPIKIVDVEPLLGGERITVYFSCEDRVDFRDLVQRLQDDYGTRVDMRQIGARDEARAVADYERCGQYCCCKNFLKVLKPISMKSAKTQKATLDPLKISGRCGRLMCCLRYEDETYEELRKRLPRRKARVGTPEGDGEVVDTQILTQLALVRLDSGTQVAVPVENLTEPGLERAPEPKPIAKPGPDRPARGPRPERTDRAERTDRRTRRRRPDADAPAGEQPTAAPIADADRPETGDAPTKKKRRRRRRRSEESGGETPPATESGPAEPRPTPDADADPDAPKKKRRRRRKRKPGAEGGPDSPPAGGDEPAS
jgi:cell fate regulator YaaT (PSP1 superfamily)